MKKTNRNSYLLRKYGITEDQYNELLKKQDYRCAICRKPASTFKSRLAVEHDHHSNFIRGLACSYCNLRVISKYRTPHGQEILRRLIEYLDGPYPGWVVPKKKKRKKRHVRRKKTVL